MKAKLIVNGKELEVEISEEEFKKFEEKKTGYERIDAEKFYYFVDESGYVNGHQEFSDSFDYGAYNAANYYSAKTVAKNNARADNLMRKLRRFAVEHRESENDYCQGVYVIAYDYEDNELMVEEVSLYKYLGAIPFDTYKTAEVAIKIFRDELIWYFTEYKDSL
jgi:hypothetical protein